MKKLMKGNDAVIHGALLGGCTHFFGYPITPASEIAHSAAYYFTKSGRTFLQAESEIAAINMILGSASAGARVMTSSSSPGVALMSECVSYIAGSNVPAVIIDVQRVGPGLGYIWPEQSDYNMVLKGGGHGVYRNIVFAPNSVQEMADFTYKAFEIADKYRMCVFILADAYIGQMMEPVSFPTKILHAKRKDWALYADEQSRHNLVTSLFMEREILSANIDSLLNKYAKVEKEITEFEETSVSDAEHIFIAFGISSRVALTAVRELRKQGIKVGLFRPKTLFPFPNKRLAELASKVKSMMVVELNDGMMANDVELAVKSKLPVRKFNWYGGYVPSVTELVEKTKKSI
ncbi:MAG: 3-methyl-2-oxobutanoate dehydrogenase subunit VorB [Lentisphaerae bacterium GWF2_38_69]|nr:MAG: 3-methyl-2-oxobutanoate dehydrogenase subunit VorB [Lentisphaerae bacterium GWF2_38_69]